MSNTKVVGSVLQKLKSALKGRGVRGVRLYYIGYVNTMVDWLVLYKSIYFF